MKELWIDPPEGWMYGFPKKMPVDKIPVMTEWILENGYPKKSMEAYGKYFHVRYWDVEDENQ